MFRTFTLFFLLFCSGAIGQTKSWDPKVLKKANTAENESYLTKQEKEVIFYLNLVRLNPKLFLETYLKKYLEQTGEKDTYTKSLQKTLASTKPMNVLLPKQDLYAVAKLHAIKFGKAGTIGHGDFQERTKEIDTNYGGYMGENCDYGNDDALDIVMSLLIDQDVAGVGHRENILDPQYKFVGTSIQPHKKYEWNCVMDFGGTAN